MNKYQYQPSVIDENQKLKGDTLDELESQRTKSKSKEKKGTISKDDSQAKAGSATSEPGSKTGSAGQSKQDLLNPSRSNKHGKSNRSSQGSISQEEEDMMPSSPSQKIRYGEDIPYDPEDIKQYLDENPIEYQPSENLEIIAERLKDFRNKIE